jgi:hypothetical protein
MAAQLEEHTNDCARASIKNQVISTCALRKNNHGWIGLLIKISHRTQRSNSRETPLVEQGNTSNRARITHR